MLKLTSIPFTAMGTECCLHLYASSLSSAKAIAFSAIQEVLRIEAYYSRYRTDSFLSQINLAAQHGNTIEVDDEIEGKRYCHLLNPKSGWPVRGLSSVSVLADHCLVAGSIASIAMLKGPAGIDWLNELAARHLWMDDQERQGGYLPTALSP